MVPASAGLFDLITSQTLVHDGDTDLRRHVLNAAADPASRGGWRFAKPKTRGGAVNPKKKVDACIALAMATSAYSDEAGLAEPWAFSY